MHGRINNNIEIHSYVKTLSQTNMTIRRTGISKQTKGILRNHPCVVSVYLVIHGRLLFHKKYLDDSHLSKFFANMFHIENVIILEFGLISWKVYLYMIRLI